MADGRPARHAKGHGGDAVDHCLRSGKTQAGCAADLGIPKRTLGKWVRARKPAGPKRAKVEETRELRKEAGRLRTENEFPKEAAALLPASQAQARGCDWRARRGRAPHPDGVPAAGRAAIQLLRLAGARRASWAGRPGPAASRGGTDAAVLWAHLGRPHDTVTALGARRRHDATRGAQARARAGRAGRAPVADPRAPPGPDLMRRDLPSPVPTTRPVGGVPHLRTGQGWLYMAVAGDLRAHGAGPGLPRAHGGRPADRRARAVPGARLRRARRDLSLGPRQPARTRGDGRPVGGARREAVGRQDGLVPRRRRRRAVPRHVRGRDVPPSRPRHPQGGATRISRVRRGMPRPPSPAPRDRLPHP